MFQPKSLAAFAGAELCKVDDEFKLCVRAHATEKAFARRIRRNYIPSARDYAVMKRWAEDFKRVHMQGRAPIAYLAWDMAKRCVEGHPDPAKLLPRGYMQFGGGADDEVARTIWAVRKSWVKLDRAGIPQRDPAIPERRQVHGLDFETIRACLADRRTHSLDRGVEMRCRHNAGRNQLCWRPPCGPPFPAPAGRDPDVPASLADIFWDCD